jgi:hypothetical protein
MVQHRVEWGGLGGTNTYRTVFGLQDPQPTARIWAEAPEIRLGFTITKDSLDHLEDAVSKLIEPRRPEVVRPTYGSLVHASVRSSVVPSCANCADCSGLRCHVTTISFQTPIFAFTLLMPPRSTLERRTAKFPVELERIIFELAAQAPSSIPALVRVAQRVHEW